MPFDVQGARAAGYRDDEIAGYLSYTSGEPIETFAGTDEEKIAELLRRRDRKMLPYSYAEQTPFDRAVAQPPEPEPDYLSRPDAAWQPEVPEEAVLPAPVRTARDWFRSGSMPVSGAPVGTGLGGPSVPDIPETAQAISDVWSGPTGERRAAGLSTLARTGMHGAMPLIAPHLGRAPVQTMMGLAYGMGGGMGAEHYLREHGVPEGYAALGGDIVGLGAGAVASVVPWKEVASRRSLAELARSEEGSVPSQREPWQIRSSELVPREQTLPRPKTPPDFSGGYTEAEINARALRNRAAEIEPPDITRHPVGSWGVDADGELMELREYSLDDPKLFFSETPGRNPTVRKYIDWINEGNEPPPLRAVETEKGTIRIQEGNHRAAAIRATGGAKVKVWVGVTHNRPIGQGQVMPEGVTHKAAIRRALEAGKPVAPEVLADYPELIMDITPEMRRSLAGGQPLFGTAVRTPQKQGHTLKEMAHPNTASVRTAFERWGSLKEGETFDTPHGQVTIVDASKQNSEVYKPHIRLRWPDGRITDAYKRRLETWAYPEREGPGPFSSIGGPAPEHPRGLPARHRRTLREMADE